MTPADLRRTLHGIARDTLRRDADLPEGDLSEHLDSMDRLALVVAIEDHFRVAFEPEDEAALTTVDDVVRVLARRLAERDAAGPIAV